MSKLLAVDLCHGAHNETGTTADICMLETKWLETI